MPRLSSVGTIVGADSNLALRMLLLNNLYRGGVVVGRETRRYEHRPTSGLQTNS